MTPHNVGTLRVAGSGNGTVSVGNGTVSIAGHAVMVMYMWDVAELWSLFEGHEHPDPHPLYCSRNVPLPHHLSPPGPRPGQSQKSVIPVPCSTLHWANKCKVCCIKDRLAQVSQGQGMIDMTKAQCEDCMRQCVGVGG